MFWVSDQKKTENDTGQTTKSGKRFEILDEDVIKHAGLTVYVVKAIVLYLAQNWFLRHTSSIS